MNKNLNSGNFQNEAAVETRRVLGIAVEASSRTLTQVPVLAAADPSRIPPPGRQLAIVCAAEPGFVVKIARLPASRLSGTGKKE